LVEKVFQIYPEFYVIKINNFNNIAKDTLDEWIYFLKNTEIPEGFKAKGLKEAREKMRYEVLNDADKKSFDQHQLALNSDKNIFNTARIEGIREGRVEGEQIGLEKGEQIGKRQQAIDSACKMKKIGMDVNTIASVTGLTVEEINALDCDV
jgi:predicted transposase/invertase (TIGR01784 family)